MIVGAALLVSAFFVLVAIRNFVIPPFCLFLCRAFPSRSRVVPKADDPSTPLLLQFMIWPGRLYLQHFLHPESIGLFHCHRWEKMRSIVLSGFFIEQRMWPYVSTERLHDWCSEWIEHVSPSFYTMTRDVIHRVAFWNEDCWTLFYMSKARSDDWGYFERLPNGDLGPMIPWREAIKSRVPSLETKEISP